MGRLMCIKRYVMLMAGVLTAAMTGCQDPVNLPHAPGSFTFSPNNVYAGAEVRIIGANAHRLTDYWLASTDPQRASADSVTLEVIAVRFDTIVARVPVIAGGNYALRVRGYPAPIAHVMVAGFRATTPHDTLDCNLEVAPGAVAAVIAGRLGRSLVKFYPATATTSELISAADLGLYQVALGRSYQPEVFFVQSNLFPFPVEAWDLRVAPRRIAVLSGVSPVLYQISDSVFFRSRGSISGTVILRDGAFVEVETFRGGLYSDVYGAAISAHGEFGLVLFNYSSLLGQPVIDGRTGQRRYHLPLETAHHATFSASQDTVFVAGNGADQINYVIAYDPRNGAEFGRWQAGPGGFVGLGLDADNNRLFVAIYHGGNVDVNILDARTLTVHGRMRGASGDSDFCWAKLVFDNSGTFVVSPNYTMAFDYLP